MGVLRWHGDDSSRWEWYMPGAVVSAHGGIIRGGCIGHPQAELALWWMGLAPSEMQQDWALSIC